MLAPTTLPDSHNATSSPASACGVTPCARGGWPDSRPVWTGSCPCQPFSVAGVGGGLDDEQHLWPFWFHLIEQCRPSVVFGEQVEAAIKHGWLDLVQSDLEGVDYAFAAVGIPAGGVGAPHIRQRLWFVADANENPGGWDARAVHGAEAPVVRGEESKSNGSSFGSPTLLRGSDGLGRQVPESCFPLLVDGSAAVLAQNGAYGNAIHAKAAQELVSAYLECRP